MVDLAEEVYTKPPVLGLADAVEEQVFGSIDSQPQELSVLAEEA
jgi:hypothetical protein